MEFVGARTLRLHPSKLWKQLKQSHEVVITTNGKPVGVLLSVDAAHLEETLATVRRVRAELAVSKLRRGAAKRGLDRTSAADINAEIQATRRARRQ